jgi:tetratricopeptide (TPR) repeat protein
MSLYQRAQRAVATPDALAAQALVRLQALQFREARDLLRRYEAASLRLSYYDYHAIGIAEAGLGNCAAATAAFREVLRANPRFADARYRTGLCLLLEAAETEALAEFRSAAEIDPASAEASRAAATLLLRGPAPADAAPYLQRLLRLDPADYDAMLQLARLHYAEGNSQEALRLAHEVLTRSGNPVLAEEARKTIAGE